MGKGILRKDDYTAGVDPSRNNRIMCSCYSRLVLAIWRELCVVVTEEARERKRRGKESAIRHQSVTGAELTDITFQIACEQPSHHAKTPLKNTGNAPATGL